jgi:hypothetical protein
MLDLPELVESQIIFAANGLNARQGYEGRVEIWALHKDELGLFSAEDSIYLENGGPTARQARDGARVLFEPNRNLDSYYGGFGWRVHIPNDDSWRLDKFVAKNEPREFVWLGAEDAEIRISPPCRLHWVALGEKMDTPDPQLLPGVTESAFTEVNRYLLQQARDRG